MIFAQSSYNYQTRLTHQTHSENRVEKRRASPRQIERDGMYTRSIMNVSRPPRGATVAFRLLGESAPRRPAAWDGLACWAGPRIRQVSIKFRITARQAGRDTSPPANGRPAAQDSGVWRHTTAERTVVCLVTTRGLIRCHVGAIFRIPEIMWFLYHYHSLRGILTQME